MEDLHAAKELLSVGAVQRSIRFIFSQRLDQIYFRDRDIASYCTIDALATNPNLCVSWLSALAED